MADPILVKMAKSRDRLLAIVSTLTDEMLDRRPAEGWSIRENLTHLVNAEEGHRNVIALTAHGQADRLPASLEIDEYNASQLAKRGRMSLADLLAALDDQRRKTEALFHTLNADQMAWRARHPVLGEMSITDIFRIIGIHEQMHVREIEAILQAEG